MHAITKADFFALEQNLTYPKGWNFYDERKQKWDIGRNEKMFVIEKVESGWEIREVGFCLILE